MPIVTSIAGNLERDPVTSLLGRAAHGCQVGVQILCESDISKEMEAENVDSQTNGGEGGVGTAAAEPMRCASGAHQVLLDESQGVTVSSQKAAFCPPGQLGVPALTERFAKMATGVTNGPKPSGDEKVLETLNLQDLKDLNVTVVSFNITTNRAVTEACPNLDERESRGFLAADLLGVELLPGCAAPTEGHRIGQRIEELLKEAKARNPDIKT